MQIITGQNERFGQWLCEHQPGSEWKSGRGHVIGLEDGCGNILAAVLFEDYNGANINMHVAAVPGKRWLNREYLWYCFYYPFVQLGCKRITGIVPSVNMAARKFDENIGFTLEATLKDAHPQGDLLVYVMTKESCKWHTLKEKFNGEVKHTTSTGLCSSR
jgi:RimJ/RimL family protein N-acetyltransferase